MDSLPWAKINDRRKEKTRVFKENEEDDDKVQQSRSRC